jgi:hypothetical protein
MEIMTHSMRAACRIGLTTAAIALAVVMAGMPGCGRDEPSVVDPAAATEPSVASTSTAAATGEWVEMEGLEPGRWVGIEGATDLEWNDETRVLRIGVGTDLNGVRWTGPLPAVPYVVELEAQRVSGSDFFCGLTFPVRDGTQSVSLIVGGWGGSLVGISSIDGLDASENPTSSLQEFENNRWYRIRVEVGAEHLQAWIDDRQVVDAHTAGQELSMRKGEIEDCAPLGLATWLTIAEIRRVRWRETGD